jgi:ribonuclease E
MMDDQDNAKLNKDLGETGEEDQQSDELDGGIEDELDEDDDIESEDDSDDEEFDDLDDDDEEGSDLPDEDEDE